MHGVRAKLVFHFTECYKDLKFGMEEKLGLKTFQINNIRNFSRRAEKYEDNNGEKHRQLSYTDLHTVGTPAVDSNISGSNLGSCELF